MDHPEDPQPLTLEVGVFSTWATLARKITARLRFVGTVAALTTLALLTQSSMGAFSVIAAGGIGAVALFVGRALKPTWTRAVVDAAGLALGDARVSRAELRDASIGEAQDGLIVELGRGLRPPIRLEVRTMKNGRDLIDALGLGLNVRPFARWTASLLSGPSALVVAVGGAFVVVLGGLTTSEALGPLAGTAWLLLVPLALLLDRWPATLEVGRDAVHHRWLWVSRTHLLTGLLRVEPLTRTSFYPHRVRLIYRDSPPVEIPISTAPVGNSAAREEVSRIVERIELAMNQASREPSERFHAWYEACATRPVSERLRTLRRGVSDYRSAAFPFTPAELWVVLDDVHAPPLERVAAAIALASKEAQARLRGAVTATAVPELRRGLTAVLEGDDATLERLLGGAAPRVRVEPEPDAAPDAEAEALSGASATPRRTRRRT